MNRALTELVTSFHAAKASRDAATDRNDCDGPEQDALDAAEQAIVRHPCQTLDEGGAS